MTKKQNLPPLVSVIITTKNEEAKLIRLLKSVQRQTYKRLEIIVVDNYSKDKTVEAAQKYTKKVYSRGPERSGQRNFGAKKAKGEFLLFLDADMKLETGVIKICVDSALSDQTIGALAIPEKPTGKKFWEKIKVFERSFYNLKGDAITDAARFFKKDIFDKAGGYDQFLTGPEDWDLTERTREMGYAVGRVSAKIIHFENIPSLFDLAKKKYYYGLTSYWYFEKHNLSLASPKTIYFLRPIFYKNGNWKKLLASPFLTAAMYLMFMVEQTAGGLGYLAGKIKKK